MGVEYRRHHPGPRRRAARRALCRLRRRRHAAMDVRIRSGAWCRARAAGRWDRRRPRTGLIGQEKALTYNIGAVKKLTLVPVLGLLMLSGSAPAPAQTPAAQ